MARIVIHNHMPAKDAGGVKKYARKPGVYEAVIAYSNNRAPQRAVKEALSAAGASEEEIASVDFNKSNFPQREFGL